MKRVCVCLMAMMLTITFNGLAEPKASRLRLATTTSTENSGLLYKLLPSFEEKYNIRVDVIAVGTGKALKLAENGDVDVVLVHARQAEAEFIKQGFGVNRREVMYNDFVIIGHKDDPAKIKSNDALIAFKKIANTKYPFTSRGDESGTNMREKELWEQAGIVPQGKWYLQTGQGMGATLRIADEKQAYCLVDRGTYIVYKDKIALGLLVEGDERLFNPYGIIAVNPKRHPHINYEHSMALIDWIASPEGQAIIGGYKINGKQLFYPSADK